MNLKYKNFKENQEGSLVRFRAETLRNLADKSTKSLKILSDLKADLNHSKRFSSRIKRPVRRVIEETLLMSEELNLITNNRHQDLYNVIFRIKKGTEGLFNDEQDLSIPVGVSLENELASDPLVCGGKASGLAGLLPEFKSNLTRSFVITSAGYKLFTEQNDPGEKIRLLLEEELDLKDYTLAETRASRIRDYIEKAEVPAEIRKEISDFAEKIDPSKSAKWAVRASFVDENGNHNFAGQFENFVDVEYLELETAYKKVISGRFSAKALMYRAMSGYREIKTPMAVLFTVMAPLRLKGTIETIDVNSPEKKSVVVNYQTGDPKKTVSVYFHADKDQNLYFSKITGDSYDDLEKSELIQEAAEMAWKARNRLGFDLSLEWGIDENKKIVFLQCSKININKNESVLSVSDLDSPLITTGGKTLFPGKAEGNIVFLESVKDIGQVTKGCAVLIKKPEEFLIPVLPIVSAVIIVEADPLDPVLSLIKELSIPCIYQLGAEAEKLLDKNIVSIDATGRKIFNGVKWPNLRESVLARINTRTKIKGESSLYDYILKLNLKNPDSPTFKAKLCGSVCDILWYIQEKSSSAIFEFCDSYKKNNGLNSYRIKTDLPLNLQVIELDSSSFGAAGRKNFPENINSKPFKALWNGISDKRLFWPKRWGKKMADMPSEFSEIVLGGNKGPRRKNDLNYIMLSKDYINFNARISFHYVMIDSAAGPGVENNHIHFRFRDGGGSYESRKLCACFLEMVLQHEGFGVERKEDIVNAWYRFYPEEDTLAKLEMTGRLVVCARELDAVLRNDTDARLYCDYFLKDNFRIFS
jgi:pyruvate,water dikinase